MLSVEADGHYVAVALIHDYLRRRGLVDTLTQLRAELPSDAFEDDDADSDDDEGGTVAGDAGAASTTDAGASRRGVQAVSGIPKGPNPAGLGYPGGLLQLIQTAQDHREQEKREQNPHKERPSIAKWLPLNPKPRHYPKTPQEIFEQTHSRSIIRALPLGLSESRPELARVVSCSLDKTLRVTDYGTGRLLAISALLGANPLDLAIHPRHAYVAVTDMSGTVSLLSLPGLDLCASVKAHHKYATRVVFTPDGHGLVTAGYDHELVYFRIVVAKTLAVAQALPTAGADAADESEASAPLNQAHAEGATETQVSLEKLQSWTMTNVPEALVFLDHPLQLAPSERLDLLVLVRGDHMMHHLALDPPSEPRTSAQADAPAHPWIHDAGRLNMNPRGDSWVSFTGLDLSLSPCGKFACVYTDSATGRLLVYRLPEPTVTASQPDAREATRMTPLWCVQELYGVESSPFAKPCAVWDPQGDVIWATSEDHAIVGFHVASGRVVSRLVGHAEAVRSLAIAPDASCLVSTGMDCTIRFWPLTSS
ncbi:hypothetical protein CXG81DRAFT_21037 [Caulochytrium protostelioides]|uniref:Uncharacterized protein n=1 Tax=Caulochytrium protostelioides TaxID=1555241 RepID=A0A4P9X2P2_9FUNG|nr:hypothetical protein CXG81DRAFT_21037 [Caulochytrium protostelioides]|eukprot:RKO98806.1 hypothetical protein CXG81DRAFT_21037 [Caulochytrium protostelioides]